MTTETKATHTPGPWTSGDLLDSLADSDRSIVAPDGSSIGVAYAYGDDDVGQAIRDANSRLIAAAPDLLKELKHLVRYFDQLTAADVENARIAIRKAEGRE